MITRESVVPLYEQIRQRLLHDIDTGGLPPHGRLPSERRLVQELGVSRITVRRALGDLVREGYLYTVPGKGVFVEAREHPYELNALLSFSAAARSRGLVPASRPLEARVLPASSSLARQLQVPAGTEVVSLRRLRLLDGVPVMLQHSWLPHALCPGILECAPEQLSLYTELSERYGLVLAWGRTVLSARLATDEECELLELAAPTAVLTVDQVTFARGDKPVELSISVYHPERYPLSIVHGCDALADKATRARPI